MAVNAASREIRQTLLYAFNFMWGKRGLCTIVMLRSAIFKPRTGYIFR
jgi:hypothetical protein